MSRYVSQLQKPTQAETQSTKPATEATKANKKNGKKSKDGETSQSGGHDECPDKTEIGDKLD